MAGLYSLDDFTRMASQPYYRPGGQFLLFAADTELGRSGLEYEYYEDAEAGAWVRAGPFTPVGAYFQFQDLFQQHTRLSSSAKRERHRAEIELLDQRIRALGLRLFHPDGTEIVVAEFRLEDCAYSLTEDPRALEIVIRDRNIYERFFSQPVA